MPLPAPPPLRKQRHVRKADRPILPLEDEPLLFPALEEVLYDKDITRKTGLRCRTCLKFARCTLGPQQMLQCFAHFLWHPHVSTNPCVREEAGVLATSPLTEDMITTLSAQELLGVYYTRHFSLWTLVDITRRGLRARLRLIEQDSSCPSPYRLTTE